MSRPRRHSPGGMVFHVLNRGVSRRLLFTKDQDFLAFERVIEETLRTRRMRVCAYCLMPNHWHFVVWPERDGDLPAFMQQVTNTHVKRWKEHRHEIGYGHLYQGRYKCSPWRQKTISTRSFATWSGTPCVPTSWSERNRGVGRVCAVWSAKTRRFASSRRGLCDAPPIGCNLSTNRKRKPKWPRCVAASIAVGPSAILTGSRTRPSDWGWNRRFGPVEGRRNNHRLVTITCIIWILQIWWLSPSTRPGGCHLRPVPTRPDGRPEPTTPWPPVGRPRPRGANHGRHGGIGS